MYNIYKVYIFECFVKRVSQEIDVSKNIIIIIIRIIKKKEVLVVILLIFFFHKTK